MPTPIQIDHLAKRVLDSTRESIFVADESGHIVFANQVSSDLFGYSLGELVGKHAADLLHYSLVEKTRVVNEIIESLRTKKTWKGDLSHHRKDGSVFYVMAEILLLVCDGKNFWLYLEQDITQLRIQEELLGYQREKLLTSSRLSTLGEMAAGLAHEINNPLTIINGRAEEILFAAQHGKYDTGQLSDAAKKIQNAVETISHLILGLRAFGREKANEPVQWVTVQSIVDYTLEFCQTRLSRRGIRLIVDEIPKDLHIECQFHQIAEALLNLILNAMDAVELVQEKWIRTVVAVQGRVVELSVSDSGKGIPEPIRHRIFEPFFSSKGVGRGRGLGLSAANGILESHGGTLSLDTTKPFTCFVIRLPRRREALAA